MNLQTIEVFIYCCLPTVILWKSRAHPFPALNRVRSVVNENGRLIDHHPLCILAFNSLHPIIFPLRHLYTSKNITKTPYDNKFPNSCRSAIQIQVLNIKRQCSKGEPEKMNKKDQVLTAIKLSTLLLISRQNTHSSLRELGELTAACIWHSKNIVCFKFYLFSQAASYKQFDITDRRVHMAE